MNAPKKVWVKAGLSAQLHAEYTDYRFKTKYIRADLVDGLVEALKVNLHHIPVEDAEGMWKARAALKAMEEE